MVQDIVILNQITSKYSFHMLNLFDLLIFCAGSLRLGATK